ncbi:hypothetical protein [Carboxylicivirga caseinilyticus]|uniref:hypothetical protein n=1 Tax=Carboxylicivirga caseinilyticus TaxID=3417572 RepID=UPI003D348CE7|nr:hypothetical protein [Marinilabiliaceae bacterium A049]
MKRSLFKFQHKRFIIRLLLIAFLTPTLLTAQTSIKGDIGVGGGISYGGIGAQLTYRPIETVGIFGSLGYNLDGVCYNLGVKLNFKSDKKINPYLTGMYGYNTVLIIDAESMETRTTYYGISTGLGTTFRLKEKSFLSFEVLLPIRPKVYKDAVDDLELVGFEIKDPLPVAVCIGYHIKF